MVRSLAVVQMMRKHRNGIGRVVLEVIPQNPLAGQPLDAQVSSS